MILFQWGNSTLAQKFDVLIFSLFGRNHWLASQLKSVGLRVALMDLTPLYQNGLAEDWEGPFPLVFPDSAARSYSQSYTDQDRSELLARGPSLRVRGQGLFEFKSDHAYYILDRWHQKGIWMAEEDGPPNLKLSDYRFQSLWLRAFLKQWRSTTLKSLRDIDEKIPEFPLNSNYVLRQPSRRGYLESASWLKDTGVEVLPVTQWWRLQQKSDGWSLSLNSNDEETLVARKFILGLTSYELQKFSAQMKLDKFEITTPTAFWVRWRARTANLPGLDFIPNYSMYLSDPEFGVFSENLVTFIKRPTGALDVWACLSVEALSDESFLNGTQTAVRDRLRSFVPELADLELEDLKMGSDLFSFWPLYKKNLPVHEIKSNLFIDSPESWPALDNHTRYLGQLQLIEMLKKELLNQSVKA